MGAGGATPTQNPTRANVGAAVASSRPVMKARERIVRRLTACALRWTATIPRAAGCHLDDRQLFPRFSNQAASRRVQVISASSRPAWNKQENSRSLSESGSAARSPQSLPLVLAAKPMRWCCMEARTRSAPAPGIRVLAAERQDAGLGCLHRLAFIAAVPCVPLQVLIPLRLLCPRAPGSMKMWRN
jgi:hypothetical protein